MPKRPDLDLPDYILERQTRPLDLLCGLGITAALILMLAIAGPKGIEPAVIEALIEQQHRAVLLESTFASYPAWVSTFCDFQA